MNTSRQSEVNGDARYAYGSYNTPAGSRPGGAASIGGSNYYGGGGYVVNPIMQGAGYNGSAGIYNYNQYGHSIVNTEPITVKKSHQIILVDPIIEQHVKSYMTWSLFNVICCCFLGGLFTTFLSCNVMKLNDNKEYKAALKLSGKVLTANMIVSGVGALLYFIVFPYFYMAIYPSLPKINW